jgi:hypothetical protein
VWVEREFWRGDRSARIPSLAPRLVPTSAQDSHQILNHIRRSNRGPSDCLVPIELRSYAQAYVSYAKLVAQSFAELGFHTLERSALLEFSVRELRKEGRRRTFYGSHERDSYLDTFAPNWKSWPKRYERYLSFFSAEDLYAAVFSVS